MQLPYDDYGLGIIIWELDMEMWDMWIEIAPQMILRPQDMKQIDVVVSD